MNYELIKNEFIKLKKEEFAYIDSVAKKSSEKTLSEYEKLEIYRSLKNYEIKLNDKLKSLWNEVFKVKKITKDNINDIIIEFDINKNFLSYVNFRFEHQKKYVLEALGIDVESFTFKISLYNLYKCCEYRKIDSDIIQNNQKLLEKPIYIFNGYYDFSEDCYGPCFGEPDTYIYGQYENILYKEYNDKKDILKKDMNNFEKGKVIIKTEKYVYSSEIKKIFEEELLNIKNKTINDCVEETENRIKNLSFIRSPEYKEKILLDRINELYKKVKGEFIKKEILYSGKFLDILREIYKLPNEKIVEKEKVIKNNGKDSVIVISITKDNEYIITFQNRIKDKIIAEFPSGYIESNEDVIEAVKRELKEETGYISNNIYIIDQAYTSPGIDNSITYIVIAKDCFKEEKTERDSNELISFDLFSEKELEYLIKSNIMNGALNKLAYYNLINNSKKYNKPSNQCLQKILL